MLSRTFSSGTKNVKLVHRLRWAVFLELKRRCPPRSAARQKLEERRVIIELNQSATAAVDDPWGRELSAIGGGDTSPRAGLHVFLHVGNPCLSPWGWSFQTLAASKDSESTNSQ